jgi:hypothetical protein
VRHVEEIPRRKGEHVEVVHEGTAGSAANLRRRSVSVDRVERQARNFVQVRGSFARPLLDHGCDRLLRLAEHDDVRPGSEVLVLVIAGI